MLTLFLASSRIIVLQPLVKSFSKKCSLVQRVRTAYLGLTSYYEEDYVNYYSQPVEEIFNLVFFAVFFSLFGGADIILEMNKSQKVVHAFNWKKNKQLRWITNEAILS